EVDVRVLIEELPGAREVVAVPPEVGKDELRVRVLADHVVPLGHQRLEPDAVLMPPIAIERELEPALVGVVERLEESRRLGDVNQHRHVQPRARLPHGVELGIVHLQTAAVGFAVEHAEVLEHLQPHRAGFEVVLELLCRAGAPAGTDAAEGHVREEDHAVLVLARAKGVDALPQPRAGAAAQVHENLQVVGLHAGHHAVELARRDRRRLMAVDVDHGKLRARHRMRRRDELRLRVVLADRRRLQLGLAPFGGTRPDLPWRLGGDARRREENQRDFFHRKIAASRKPNSAPPASAAPRVATSLRATIIPLASPLLARSSDLPGDRWTGRPASLFGLAPCGVLPATRVATGAVRSYRTFSPLPAGPKDPPPLVGRGFSYPAGGCFLCPCPSWCPAPALPPALPPRA